MKESIRDRIAQLRAQLEENIHDSDRWMKLSELLQQAGDETAAGEALFRGGAVLARDGQVHRGIALAKRGVALAPDLEDADESLGRWHAELQLTAEARAYFELALEQATRAKDAAAAVRIIEAIERL